MTMTKKEKHERKILKSLCKRVDAGQKKLPRCPECGADDPCQPITKKEFTYTRISVFGLWK